MRFTDLLCTTDKGIYCPPGDFYIDPVRAVPRALVTHGHSDHARRGHGAVLATPETLRIMAERYGEDFAGSRQEAVLGEAVFDRRRPRDVPSRRPRARLRPGRRGEGRHCGSSPRATTSGAPTRPAAPSSRCPATSSSPRRPSRCRCSAIPTTAPRSENCSPRSRQFPDRTHLVGAYALGKAQRVIALLREAGYAEPIYIHGALQRLCELYQEEGVDLGPLEPATLEKGRKHDFAGAIVIGPPSAFADRWARRFADPVACFASGWMRVRQRARQRGVELPLVISDHCDWDEICDTIREVSPAGSVGDAWQRGGAGALVRAAGPPRKTAASDGIRGGAGMSEPAQRRSRRRSPISARFFPPMPPASTMPTPAW